MNRKELDTVIDKRPESVDQAVKAWTTEMLQFVSPESLGRSPLFAKLVDLRPVVATRLEQSAKLATDIISKINERTRLLKDPETIALFEKEKRLWAGDNEEGLVVGVRTCVDAGVPLEAVLGMDKQESVGRSLAGDDDLIFLETEGRFILLPSGLKKRMIHQGRQGEVMGLEILLEHTGCGRRGQMLSNPNNPNISGIFSHVVRKLEYLFPGDKEAQVPEKLQEIGEAWFENEKTPMNNDGGVWIGTMVKIAQRQAYQGIPDRTMVVPIELYDKFDGNLLVGLDSLEALGHKKVLSEGGYTKEALEVLIQEGVVFSLRHETSNLSDQNDEGLEAIREYKGKHTFDDLKTHWLEVNKSIVHVIEQLWDLYQSDDPRSNNLKNLVLKYMNTVFLPLKDNAVKIDESSTGELSTKTLIERRMIHHLFRVMSYAWVLDTFTNGHPPGAHIEDHLATGDSGRLGVMEHMTLGQGDIKPPTYVEMFTGRAVLLHSVPGHEGSPIVLFLKNDTLKPDKDSMSNEETNAAMANFTELLNIWPYLVVGDVVSFLVIRGKLRNGEISRVGLSVLKNYENFLLLYEAGMLPKIVPAVNSKNEIVMISAQMVLDVGIKAGKDLVAFRRLVQEKADLVSDPDIQKALRVHYEG